MLSTNVQCINAKKTYNASLHRLEQVHLPHVSWLFLTFFSFVSILEPTGLFQWKSHSALERINNIMTQSIPLQTHEYRSILGGVCSSPPISSCDSLHKDLARLIIVSPGVAGCRLSPKRFTHLRGHTPPAWWEILSAQGDGTASGQLSLILSLPPTVLMRRWPGGPAWLAQVHKGVSGKTKWPSGRSLGLWVPCWSRASPLV